MSILKRIAREAPTIIGTVGGALAAVEAVVTPGSDVHTAAFGGGGLVLETVTLAMKLFHDRGVNVATITTVGAQAAAELPKLKADVASVVHVVETDVPAAKGAIAHLEATVDDLLSKLPVDPAAIESAVRSVLAGVAAEAPAANTGVTPADAVAS